MVTVGGPEPVFAGFTRSDQRRRPQSPADGVPSDASAQTPRPKANERQSPPPQDEPLQSRRPRSGSANFAAAVIAGALPPRPQSMQELVRRIGSSEIPPESMSQLKDILT